MYCKIGRVVHVLYMEVLQIWPRQRTGWCRWWIEGHYKWINEGGGESVWSIGFIEYRYRLHSGRHDSMMPEVRIGLIMNGFIIRQDWRIRRIETSSLSLYLCCEPWVASLFNCASFPWKLFEHRWTYCWIQRLEITSCHQIKVYILKGQCHEILDFRFFSRISFPHVPEYPM